MRTPIDSVGRPQPGVMAMPGGGWVLRPSGSTVHDLHTAPRFPCDSLELEGTEASCKAASPPRWRVPDPFLCTRDPGHPKPHRAGFGFARDGRIAVLAEWWEEL